MTNDETLADKLERRTEKQRRIIYAVAEYPDKTCEELSEYCGASTSYVYNIKNEYEHLIQQASNKMEGPSAESVSMALNDDGNVGKQILADGMGEREVEVTMTMEECFRCIRLLPIDLSRVFYTTLAGQAARQKFEDYGAE